MPFSTQPETTIRTNIPAPKMDPIAIFATVGSGLVNDAMAEKISAAPPPNATRVTPATLSFNRSCAAIARSVGTKNPSAMVPIINAK